MKKSLLLLLVFFHSIGCIQKCLGQRTALTGQEKIDSLEKILQKSATDSVKINLLNAISKEYRRNNPEEGIRNAQQALELAQKINWTKGIANSYDMLGENCAMLSENVKAIQCYDKAIDLQKAVGNVRGIVKVTIDYGEVKRSQSDFPEALDYFFKALKMAEDSLLQEDVATCLISIGLVLESQRNYAKSLDYLFNGLDIYEKLKKKDGMTVALGYIGTVYFLKIDFENSLLYYDSALKIAQETNDKKNIAENTMNIGNVYSEDNKNELALTYQFKALGIYREIGNKRGIANILGNIGITYFTVANDSGTKYADSRLIPLGKNANLKKSIEYLLQAIDMEKQIGDLSTLQSLYENLSDAYALSGKQDAAYDYLKKSNTLKDSIFSESNNTKIGNIQKAYELEKQKEIDKIKETQNRRERIFYALGLGLLVLIVVLIGIGYNTQRKLNQTITKLVDEQEHTIQERTKELAISNEKLALSNAELARYNQELFELIQFNAHNIREPLTRIMGAMLVHEFLTNEEFHGEIWPQMQKAVSDLDNNVKSVILKADETIKLHKKPLS